MNKTKLLLSLALSLSTTLRAAEPLDRQFQNPPDAVKPSCYWMWFNTNVDKEGITRDLEEMKSKGLSGAYLYTLSPNSCGTRIPQGPDFLSPEWKELYRHALKEADRLGLELGINLGSGWLMGGPWITPDNASRWFLQSELQLTGPQKFSGTLPLPGPKDGYDSPPQLQVRAYINLPLEKVDYQDTAIVAFREPERARLGNEDPRRKHLAAKSNREDASVFTRPSTVTNLPLTPWAALPDDQPIAPGEMIDLTDKVGPDGKLDWDVPEDSWTIIRTGHRMTGSQMTAAAKGGEGLAVDFFSTTAVDQQWKNVAQVYLDEAGPLVGKTLKYLGTDSFEDGYPNWTANFVSEFQRYRGYDPKPYLPVLKGRLVGNAELSDRFLHDYRKTMADCMADNHYGHFTKLTNEKGMQTLCEAAGPSWSQTMCMDALKNLGRVDMPMGEFWRGLFLIDDQNQVAKQTASAAHIYGRKTASAEAFTSFSPDWDNGPSLLKPIVNRAFCEGINRLVFHCWTSQKPQDGMPGYEFGAGTHFNPNVTWWNQAAKPWLSYVNRCQALLQSGLFVADVLYYNGDGAPNLVDVKHVPAGLGKGYDYDVCNEDVLLTRLSVKDGLIALPDGMSYRILSLPDSKRMPLAVIRKIAELVKAGATVVGPRPDADPGLKNYPESDAAVRQIAAELWGNIDGKTVVENRVGKGRVFQGKSLREILLAEGVKPDFEAAGANDIFIDFIHRTTPEAEIYFLANRKDRPEKVIATFRQAGRQPELWNPVTGEQRDLPQFQIEGGRTIVPLEFEPNGSMFVVFRKPATIAGQGENFEKLKTVQTLEGPWTVQFDKDWFYPTAGLTGEAAEGKIVFEKLEDWSKRPEEAVKHFSGTAVYGKVFSFQPSVFSKDKRFYLDLGTFSETAKVTLNGKDLGVLWCAPKRVEITEALKAGENELKIEVVNNWPNRLIGDGKLPAEQRRTRTNIEKYNPLKTGEHTLLPSGLLGPVSISTTQ